MRTRFDLGTPIQDQFTVVIILNIAGRVMGIVVSCVSDGITLSAGQINPVSKTDSAFNANCLIGLGALEERMLTLVNIDTLMSLTDVALIEEATAT